MSEGQVYCLDYSLLFQLWEERWLWYCWGKCFERERICRTGLRFLTEVTHGEDTIFVVEYILAVLDQPGRIYLWREHLYCYYNTPGSLSKVTAAMISSIEYKMAAGYRLGEATGASTENLVEAFLVDQVHYRNQNFRSMLWECKWYQIRNGVRRTRAVIQTPEFCSMLRDDEKVRVFGNRYRRVLRSGNPLLIYLYFSLWKKKTQLIEHPLIKKLCPRRLERC